MPLALSLRQLWISYGSIPNTVLKNYIVLFFGYAYCWPETRIQTRVRKSPRRQRKAFYLRDLPEAFVAVFTVQRGRRQSGIPCSSFVNTAGKRFVPGCTEAHARALQHVHNSLLFRKRKNGKMQGFGGRLFCSGDWVQIVLGEVGWCEVNAGVGAGLNGASALFS